MSRRVTLAKISRPRLFGVVPRERLFALLDGNRGRPLIWISGPPGAGKTTLVASYLADRGLPTLWYQVDAGDADPASLFHYLSLAAQRAGTGESIPLPRFVAEHLVDLTAFARLFFRAFFSQVPEGSVLVLDNCQEAPQDAPLHEIARQAVAEAPPNSTVVAISRVEAPSTFTQLSANGTMARVGWDKLQLTLEEVRAIAVQRKLTDDWLIKALHQQSQGWAAGITLMLERLGSTDGNSQELPTETRESVFNYFASLIFDQAPESTRHVLLSIAFLPRVTPCLARELSGRAEAPAVLEDLYRRRMFTDRRTGPEPVYQFHALFLDFLGQRARRVLGPMELAERLSRSASALEGAGELDAAMDLWLESRNWGEATRLVLKNARSLLNSGRRQTLTVWIQAIPGLLHAREPWLVYWLGCAQLQVGPEEGVRTLERALTLFREADDRQGRLECLAALLRGAFMGFQALELMDGWLDELLGELERLPDFQCADLELRIWGVVCMTLFHVRPWHPLVRRAYRRVEELLPHCTDPSVVLGAATGALVVSGLCGDFERGESIAAATAALASRDTASPSEAAWWFAQVGYLKFVEARYEEALDYLERGRRIAESNGLGSVLEVIVLWRFSVEFRVAGWAVAEATLVELEALLKLRRSMTDAMQFLFQARRASHRGRSGEAADLAVCSDQAVMRSGSRLEEMIYGLCNADILLEAGRVEDAKPLLSRSRALIDRTPVYDCWRGAQLWMEAWLANAEGDVEQALTLLRQSLRLARDGERRYFLRFPDRALAPLLRLALDRGIEADLVQDLIRMFRIKPPKNAPDNWPWPVRIYTLGRFEVQVNGEALEFSRKLPRKTLLLLKAIVALGGVDVREQALCDALWCDEEGDAARNALAITVLRLRKLLGSNETVLQRGGCVSLSPEMCWVDAQAFEARLAEHRPLAWSALSLYGGTFLPEDEDEPWSVAPRERLRGRFIHALSMRGAALEAQGDAEGALECYLRGIDADPIVESFYVGMMHSYERLGRRTEALSTYRRLRHTLSVLLGIPPSDGAQRLFQTLLGSQKGGAGMETGVDEDAEPTPGLAGSGPQTGVVARLPVRNNRAR